MQPKRIKLTKGKNARARFENLKIENDARRETLKIKSVRLEILGKRICSLGSETTAVENEFAADWGSSKNSPKNAGGIRQLSLRRVGEALASGLGILSKWHSSSHTRD